MRTEQASVRVRELTAHPPIDYGKHSTSRKLGASRAPDGSRRQMAAAKSSWMPVCFTGGSILFLLPPSSGPASPTTEMCVIPVIKHSVLRRFLRPSRRLPPRLWKLGSCCCKLSSAMDAVLSMGMRLHSPSTRAARRPTILSSVMPAN